MLIRIFVISLWLVSACAHAAYTKSECEIMMGSRRDLEGIDALIEKCVSDSVEKDRISALEEKQKETDEIAKKLASKSQSIFINEFKIYDVDSAGGVNIGGFFSNPKKTSAIKYLRMKATLFNAVGDVIRSEIGGKTSQWLFVTGPLKWEDDPQTSYWRAAWYNVTASCVKIDTLQVEYMNGKVVSLTGHPLMDALDPTIKNDCKPK